MRLKGLFWILTTLLLTILAVVTYYVFYTSSIRMFFAVEALVLLTIIYLFVFYRRIIKPLHIIGNGMELLKEQDFSSRLGKVGQTEADRVVDVFNKMMEQLKNERLHLREQNHFLDLLVNASPMGVIILNLDEEILSMNPAACKLFGAQSSEDMVGKRFLQLDSPLAEELVRVPMYQAQTVRLNDANIYKCTHSSFVDRGFHHQFYLIETLTQEVFKAEKKAYEKVIRMISHEVNNTTAGITSTLDTLESTFSGMEDMEDVCACKRFMETVCQNRNIEIVMDLSEESPVVNLDNSLFEQVLVNIIKNAAESIERDGKIYIRTTVRPTCLEIADTGKGIDKETETKLFSPFFSTKPNGQGIGLIFIREVLLKHDCRFSLRSYADGLTRFKIWFS